MNAGRTTVYFDGGCPGCARGKRHFSSLDWADRLDWVDLLRQPDALQGFGVDFANAMEFMHVVDRHGRLHVGGHAFLALWSELPGYRHLAALLGVLGLEGILDRFYRWMTRGRYLRRCQDGVCGVRADVFEGLAASFGDAPAAPDERRQRVRGLFARIAPRYDLMNDLMSFGIHRLWKRRMLWGLDPRRGQRIVDLAGGTGDLAVRLQAHGCEVIVCDPAREMMRVGRSTAPRSIKWVAAAGESLPLADASVDGLVMAFGLRNMTSPSCALAEILRVLQPGGRFVCLEFSRPHPLVAPLYDLFSRTVIPALGALIAGDPAAYRYLVESIRRFPSQEVVAAHLRETGFEKVRYRNVSFGIGCIHVGLAGAGCAHGTPVSVSPEAAATRPPGSRPARAAAGRSLPVAG